MICLRWGDDPMSGNPWITTVNEAVLIFRDALLAVIPSCERGHIPWRDDESYDDWDLISESLYQAFVVSALVHSDEWKPPHELPEYGFDIEDYSGLSFLSPAERPTELAFVCLLTDSSPFDTALFKRLDAAGKAIGEESMPLDGVYFVLSARSAGSMAVIDGMKVE
jgi:hypothetical protein